MSKFSLCTAKSQGICLNMSRPKIENPTTSSERARKSTEKNLKQGKKARRFWLSPEQIEKYNLLISEGYDYDKIIDLAHEKMTVDKQCS